MREIRPSGSEGGGTGSAGPPYPYQVKANPRSAAPPATGTMAAVGAVADGEGFSPSFRRSRSETAPTTTNRGRRRPLLRPILSPRGAGALNPVIARSARRDVAISPFPSVAISPLSPKMAGEASAPRMKGQPPIGRHKGIPAAHPHDGMTSMGPP